MRENDLSPSHNATRPRALAGGTSPGARERTLDVARRLASSGPSLQPAPPLRLGPPLQPDAPTMLTDESLVRGGNPVDDAFACGPIPPGTALILRTSGSTTGVGSLVAISREALLASAAATEEALGGPGRWVTCLPTDHIAGFQTQFRSAVAGLAPVDAGAGRPEDLARAAEFDADFAGESAPLYASLVPTQLRRLLASPAARAARRFDAVLVGGAAAGARLLEAARAAGLKVVTTYGMTETCGGCVYDGRPIGDARVAVEAGDAHAAVEAGRIVLSGSAVALGYVGGPGFAGTFRTSDVGRVEAGRLTVLGRADDAITTGGMTIMPAVVEEALARSGAGESVVVGIDDDEWGEIAVAVVGATGLSRPTASKMRKAIAEEHGKAYVPRLFLSFSDLGLSDPEPSSAGSCGLPLTASGKPDRRAIRELVRRALDRRSPSS